MQSNAPELVDLSKESADTRKLYGVDQDATKAFGTKCLLARRMVERGVRFVQLYSGGLLNGDDWDGHAECDKNHQRMASRVDKPIAGLLADLKQRGLLESTLVVWGGNHATILGYRGAITKGCDLSFQGRNFPAHHGSAPIAIWAGPVPKQITDHCDFCF
jgi:arylsulfatase A-like enzyme